MKNLKTVFYHELGHYVSEKLNQYNFNTYGVEFIKISQHKNFYIGETKPIKPNISNDKITLNRLPHNLANIIYGCIFQSYYLNDDNLKNCLNSNGFKDVDLCNGFLVYHSISYLNSKFFALSQKYLVFLIKNQLLKNFFELDFEKYLVESGNNFTVELSKLDLDIFETIKKHEKVYLNYVSDIENLIENK